MKVQRVKVQHGADGSATDVSTASPLPVDQTNTTVADGGVLPAKGVQIGGTDGSVFQVMSTDNAGRPNVNINGTVDTELAAAGALADGAANPTTSVIGAFLQCFNGATWDRARGDTTNGIDVDVTRVSGTVTIAGAVTNAGTFAVQDSQVVADNGGFTDGTTKVFPAGYVFDEVAGTALTENDAAAARIDSKRAQVGVIEDATTRGQRAAVSAAGRLSVDASGVAVPITDNSGSLTVDAPVGTPAFVRLSDGAAAITALPVTDNAGSLTVDNAGTFAVQDSEKIADDAAFTVATTKLMPIGFLADQTSTDSVNEGDIGAARITLDRKLIVTTAPSPDTEGADIFRSVDLDETEEDVKTSAGKLYGYYIANLHATNWRYVKLYNATAANTTVGSTTPIATLPIPPNSAANAPADFGITFGTALCAAATTGVADADTGAPGANEVVCNLWYK